MSIERFPVEEGAILMFARAIGDPNPAYSDRTSATAAEVGAVLAPPTFVQSAAQFDPDYPLRPKLGEPWLGSGKEPSGRARPGEAGGTGLHAEQHFEYHRPLLAGAVLRPTSRLGERWEKQGRSGKLVFSETITEYRDQDGELIVSARSVVVVTERPVAQEA